MSKGLFCVSLLLPVYPKYEWAQKAYDYCLPKITCVKDPYRKTLYAGDSALLLLYKH